MHSMAVTRSTLATKIVPLETRGKSTFVQAEESEAGKNEVKELTRACLSLMFIVYYMWTVPFRLAFLEEFSFSIDNVGFLVLDYSIDLVSPRPVALFRARSDIIEIFLYLRTFKT